MSGTPEAEPDGSLLRGCLMVVGFIVLMFLARWVIIGTIHLIAYLLPF